jgi:hypothetical protein
MLMAYLKSPLLPLNKGLKRYNIVARIGVFDDFRIFPAYCVKNWMFLLGAFPSFDFILRFYIIKKGE